MSNINDWVEILIQGTVQGVGFRPFVYNLATRFHIIGSVANTSKGVVIQAGGAKKELQNFIEALEKQAPPLAKILSTEVLPLPGPVEEPDGFTIIHSTSSGGATAIIPPDIAVCGDCFNDLSEESNRRFNYPFTNCTNCGPRFTITENIPYDRPQTSMRGFGMCELCSGEYSNPADRRFHAQPNACPACGPQVSWHDPSGISIESENPLAAAVEALAEGKVVGIRGLGGFHLAVDGFSQKAIQLMRDRKGRPAKPLAIMVKDIYSAAKFAEISAEEIDLMQSPQHPIVLLRKKAEFPLPENLAPGVRDVGIMLPYTPLHHLLFLQENCPVALVMTSGNISGIPICTANDDAVATLGHIVDNFLFHNRDIVTRVDDSVAKVVEGIPRLYRRARGYVPSPVVVPFELPPFLACGGGLKSTFCLARNTTVFPSQHIGDLANLESYDFFTESVEHLKSVFEIEPEAVACDLHPDYMSTRYATQLGLPLYRVQHHHAHAVAVMAEHGQQEEVLALILDGTGYGDDGTIWGGEILRSTLTDYQRMGHLSLLPLPGGDKAAAEPWRIGLALLSLINGEHEVSKEMLPSTLQGIDEANIKNISMMLKNDFNCPKTSSCGRLFDGISSLLGIRQTISYEGQAAIEMESLAWKAALQNWKDDLSFYMLEKNHAPIEQKNGKWEISVAEFVTMAVDSVSKNIPVSTIALEFHFMLIARFVTLLKGLSEKTGIQKVVLSGGCLQNSLLLEGLIHGLVRQGLTPLTPEEIPLNDGGISLGQAIIGGLQHVYRTTNEGH